MTFSFKTDRTGSNLRETVKVIKGIISSHETLLGSLRIEERAKIGKRAPIVSSDITLSGLGIPGELKEKILNNIRRVPMFKLVVIFLNYSSMTYDNIMALSKELGKPITYDWLNTEFHRKKHRGLIRSEPIPRSKEKEYSLTELGRKKAEATIEEIKNK